MPSVLADCDRDVLLAAETAVDNWKLGLKERKNGNVLAVESIQLVERAVPQNPKTPSPSSTRNYN